MPKGPKYHFAKIGYAAPGIVIAIGIITPTIFLDKKINSMFAYFGKDVGLINKLTNKYNI